MNSRTQKRVSSKSIFDEVSFSTLDWPGKTVRLERDSLQDYCQRPTSPNVSIAELYHENSKLFPQKLPELAATRFNIDEIQRQFLQRQKSAICKIPVIDVAGKCRELLGAALTSIPQKLFYAIEIRLALKDVLAICEPISDKLHLLKHLSSDDRSRLQNALQLCASPNEKEEIGPVLLIVGNFARNDLLFGSRGYRRTLIEAGRVAQAVLDCARQRRLTLRTWTEFSDHDLDQVTEVNGIEEGVIIAIEIEE